MVDSSVALWVVASSNCRVLSMRDGDFDQAIEQLQKSLALYQQLNLGKSYYDYYLVEAYAALRRVHTSAGDHVRAVSFVNKALAIAKTLSHSAPSLSLLLEMTKARVEKAKV